MELCSPFSVTYKPVQRGHPEAGPGSGFWQEGGSNTEWGGMAQSCKGNTCSRPQLPLQSSRQAPGMADKARGGAEEEEVLH